MAAPPSRRDRRPASKAWFWIIGVFPLGFGLHDPVRSRGGEHTTEGRLLLEAAIASTNLMTDGRGPVLAAFWTKRFGRGFPSLLSAAAAQLDALGLTAHQCAIHAARSVCDGNSPNIAL